jgi:hypothetical protein
MLPALSSTRVKYPPFLSETAFCDVASRTSAGPFGQATAAISYQQFYKAIFTTVHMLYPGHNAAGRVTRYPISILSSPILIL